MHETDDDKSIVQFIDEHIVQKQNETVLYCFIDTEVAYYNTRNPKLSLIQLLVITEEELEECCCDLVSLLTSDPIPDSGTVAYYRIERTRTVPESVDADAPTTICERLAQLNARIVVWDVLYAQKETLEYITQHIIYNHKCYKIFHNAKFDLKFLSNGHQLPAPNVNCTLEMAKAIPFHRLPVESSYSLDNLVRFFVEEKLKDRCQEEVQLLRTLLYNSEDLSDCQTSEWHQRPLTEQQLRYAALDVLNLIYLFIHLKNIHDTYERELQVLSDDILNKQLELSLMEREYKIMESKYQEWSSVLKQEMIRKQVMDSEYYQLIRVSNSSSGGRRMAKLKDLVQICGESLLQDTEQFPDLNIHLTQAVLSSLDQHGIDVPTFTSSNSAVSTPSYRLTRIVKPPRSE